MAKPVCASRVKSLHPISPAQCDEGGRLHPGELLKYMDATACMAAERHCGRNSVTISMDDLQFEAEVSAGAVVAVVAQVNNAFRTSMEIGVGVTSEDPFSGRSRVVATAFFTFVAIGTDGA